MILTHFYEETKIATFFLHRFLPVNIFTRHFIFKLPP